LFIPRKYVAGPDINTGEREMQWFVGATGNWRSATGKPANYCLKVSGEKDKKCGIPHEFGSTGFGVAQATVVAAEIAGILLKNALVAIHGFGNVGSFTYEYLTEMGAIVVALVDKSGAFYAKQGFDNKEIAKIIQERKLLSEGRVGWQISSDEFWALPVDILIPASVTDVINQSNKDKIKAKIIVEAGNIPMSEGIEEELSKKGILVVPDFVANMGGVISSFAEYRGFNAEKMFKLVEEKVKNVTRLVLERSLEEKENPRKIALEVAKSKVKLAMTKNSPAQERVR